MEMRNMPAPGEEDMGGNPLQEGILADGGWQNRQKRDESFASVQAAHPYDRWLNQPQYGSICPRCGEEMEIDPDDGEPVCPYCRAEAEGQGHA
jgi:NADH pyrophosphatase NudC (nudix superfamily)